MSRPPTSQQPHWVADNTTDSKTRPADRHGLQDYEDVMDDDDNGNPPTASVAGSHGTGHASVGEEEDEDEDEVQYEEEVHEDPEEEGDADDHEEDENAEEDEAEDDGDEDEEDEEEEDELDEEEEDELDEEEVDELDDDQEDEASVERDVDHTASAASAHSQRSERAASTAPGPSNNRTTRASTNTAAPSQQPARFDLAEALAGNRAFAFGGVRKTMARKRVGDDLDDDDNDSNVVPPAASQAHTPSHPQPVNHPSHTPPVNPSPSAPQQPTQGRPFGSFIQAARFDLRSTAGHAPAPTTGAHSGPSAPQHVMRIGNLVDRGSAVDRDMRAPLLEAAGPSSSRQPLWAGWTAGSGSTPASGSPYGMQAASSSRAPQLALALTIGSSPVVNPGPGDDSSARHDDPTRPRSWDRYVPSPTPPLRSILEEEDVGPSAGGIFDRSRVFGVENPDLGGAPADASDFSPPTGTKGKHSLGGWGGFVPAGSSNGGLASGGHDESLDRPRTPSDVEDRFRWNTSHLPPMKTTGRLTNPVSTEAAPSGQASEGSSGAAGSKTPDADVAAAAAAAAPVDGHPSADRDTGDEGLSVFSSPDTPGRRPLFPTHGGGSEPASGGPSGSTTEGLGVDLGPPAEAQVVNGDGDKENGNGKRSGEELAPRAKKNRRFQRRRKAGQELDDEESAFNGSTPSAGPPAPVQTKKKACNVKKCTCGYKRHTRKNATTVPVGGFHTPGPCGLCRCCTTSMEAHILAKLPVANFPPFPAFGDLDILRTALTLTNGKTDQNHVVAAAVGHTIIETLARDIAKEFDGLTQTQREILVSHFVRSRVLRVISSKLQLHKQVIGGPYAPGNGKTDAQIFRATVYALVQDKQLDEATSYLAPAFTPLLQWLSVELAVGRIA